MLSSRALGVFALCAVILAAISFAAVDIVVANSGTASTLPAPAVVYAIIGTLALLASVVPAFMWLARAIDHPHHDADIEPMPASVLASSSDEDDL